MFEAKLLDGSILKRIVEAIKDVVNDVNIDVSPSGKHLLNPKMPLWDFVSTISNCDYVANFARNSHATKI